MFGHMDFVAFTVHILCLHETCVARTIQNDGEQLALSVHQLYTGFYAA